MSSAAACAACTLPRPGMGRLLRPRASSHSDSLARLGLAETIRLPEGADVPGSACGAGRACGSGKLGENVWPGALEAAAVSGAPPEAAARISGAGRAASVTLVV